MAQDAPKRRFLSLIFLVSNLIIKRLIFQPFISFFGKNNITAAIIVF